MFDCFISYSFTDERFAIDVNNLHKQLGLKPFMAQLSLQPGQQWSSEITQALQQSPWVIFLASRAACASHSVQQEVGGAVFGNKKLVPVIWDIKPEELPGWTKEYQVLDLRGLTDEAATSAIQSIAEKIQADKHEGILIGVALLAGLIFLLIMINRYPLSRRLITR